MRWFRGHKILSGSFIVILLTAIILLIALYGCSNNSNELRGKSKSLQVVEIPPLDATNNPYKGQYADWDRWVLKNMVGVVKGRDNDERGPDPAGTFYLSTILDDEGWMVPYLKYVELRNQAQSAATQGDFDRNHVYVIGAGPMDRSLYNAIGKAALPIQAGFFRKIPDWAATAPAKITKLMPNGDVVTRGPLGSGVGGNGEGSNSGSPNDGSGCCGGSGESWYRYDSNGTLLRTSSKSWWDLYYDTEVEKRPAGSMVIREDGYVVFKDRYSTLLSVYDYDGTKCEVTSEPPMRDAHLFMSLPATNLTLLYKAQQGTLQDSDFDFFGGL